MPRNTNPSFGMLLSWRCFFLFDQIIVFQRILDMSLLRGQIELLMLSGMAVMCLCIPVLRTPIHIYLFAALMLCSLFMGLTRLCGLVLLCQL